VHDGLAQRELECSGQGGHYKPGSARREPGEIARIELLEIRRTQEAHRSARRCAIHNEDVILAFLLVTSQTHQGEQLIQTRQDGQLPSHGRLYSLLAQAFSDPTLDAAPVVL